MKYLFIGSLVGAALVYAYSNPLEVYALFNRSENASTSSPLSIKKEIINERLEGQFIQEELRNVSKLIVSEGFFSDVITYADAKKYYVNWLSVEKKAVIIAKAKVILAYDLRGLKLKINEEDKKIIITEIPEPDIDINPKIEYYDIKDNYLNPFKSEDYNRINKLVDKRLKEQIDKTSFESNGENRLISELLNLLNQMGYKGWEIIFDDNYEEEDLLLP